ncbi:MAG: pyruvate, phosphate dikinase [Spirochaetales bacterium]|nr:pyruvate, phosphate dikinase [Spirochaetales bacterium]
MKNNIHFFKQGEFINNQDILDKIGIRGRGAMELASLDLPILPGFIIDADVASHLDKESLKKYLEPQFKKIKEIKGKDFGNQDDPLLVKIVVSPNLAVVSYPTLHNYGLTRDTLNGFNKFVGEHFGYHEVQFLIKGNLEIELKIAELEGRKKDFDTIRKALGKLRRELSSSKSTTQEIINIDEYLALLPEGFFDDAYTQLELALKRISHMLNLDELDDDDTAILIQPMVYGNFGKDSSSGNYYTRNVVTGEQVLQGDFYQNEFDSIGASGKNITQIEPVYLKRLQTIAKTIEDHFKEIRYLRFTIENKNLWLIEQRAVVNKSTQADIKLLLELLNRKVIDNKYMIKAIKTEQLHEILHPVVNLQSTKKLHCLEGGISGAPGAAIGKIYFSTEDLIDAHKLALQYGEDTRFILCLSASFAEDVKAIEVAHGILSSEGGYAAHASVVARQYGKVSLVKNEMKIRGKKAIIGKTIIKEGDYITLNVPHYGDPQIFLGEAKLIEPDFHSSGLLEFINVIKTQITDFHVRANSDNPKDAELAKLFGADGIGLCRTEHMFFDEKRINVFREMIISDSGAERLKALSKLKPMQRSDFYKLFKIMIGKPVTIRLLDAPLHEFLPHNDSEMSDFVKFINPTKGKVRIPEKEIRARCETLDEFNPMLGHRGCRIAISYPEIYEMQVTALFEAVYSLQKEGINVQPEIMVPLIMNEQELKIIMYGKNIEGQSIRGLLDIEESVRLQMEAKKVDYKIGTMIELPCAALSAGEIARYAEFFSFGTNDLTQTTIGLSRDDFNNFMPDYTQFDILENNPFQMLNRNVKELISIAHQRGRMTRPNLKLGLCGEHGAIPENIRFCMETGLNYVSCSAFSIPIANLAIAQLNIEREEARA